MEFQEKSLPLRGEFFQFSLTMASEIHFTKMHGIGNDYIYINCMEKCPERLPDLAREMSDRHKGIGGDGIILILPSDKADFKMRIFNADGSEAKMCGNGSRCVAKFLHDYKLTDKTTIHLETLAGIKVLSLNMDGNEVASVTVDMGRPSLDPKEIGLTGTDAPMIDAPVLTSDGIMKLTAVSMGNPHGVVVMTDELGSINLPAIGKELELHPMWADRANIEFIRIISPDEIEMRVWERGSGETQACGTGACAAVVASSLLGLTGSDVKVHLLGGDLDISVKDDRVMMTGGAATVFTGTYHPSFQQQ